MHKYLSAIGFSCIKKREDYEKLIRLTSAQASERSYTSIEEDAMLSVFCKEFAPGIGLAVVGDYDEQNCFSYEYSYPYLKGTGITSTEDLTVERHSDKESYAGICDDINVGIMLIFYLQNIIPYIRAKNTNNIPVKGTTVTLSALSVNGTIMMPIMKDERVKAKVNRVKRSRNRLIQAAREGDEEAIESLSLDDMDTYTSLAARIKREDLYTIVDTYFMPYGVECDQYSILGEILEVNKVTNFVSRENIWKLKVLCNELSFDLCINEKDLYGEPEIGRRFKGVIWLQGYINFPK